MVLYSTMCELTDEELMKQHLNGDESAISVIFLRYQKRIFNFNLRYVSNRADAEEITADVFLTLLTANYQVYKTTKFSTWLFTISRNRCISHIRKHRKFLSLTHFNKNRSERTEIEIPDNTSNPLTLSENDDRVVLVRQSIDRLPLEQKEAILLREYQKLSYEEISLIMNCSLEKIKILLYRARKTLKVYLKPLLDDNNEIK